MKLSCFFPFLIVATAVAAELPDAASLSLSRRKQQFVRHLRATQAERTLLAFAPSIHIANTVYLGSDGGAACDSAVEFVEAAIGDSVVYCFNVTNNGYTFLNNILLTNDELSFTEKSTEQLAPGQSKLFAFPSIITAPRANLAVVTANPIFEDGRDMDVDDVRYQDTSTVAIKNPYSAMSPPISDNCLQDSWSDAINTDELICSAKEVFLDPNSITSEPMTCVSGDMVKVTVNAAMHVLSTRYDLGWYVAADGGDALAGTCHVNAFQQGNEYRVNEDAGFVAWDEEQHFYHTNDKCGDIVVMREDTPGILELSFVVNGSIRCSDADDNGKMDMSVCFTWRKEENDEVCTLVDTDPDTVGRLPDLYPGTATGSCYCTSYEIPTITVTKTTTTDCK